MRSHSNSFGNNAEKDTAGCRASYRKSIVIGGKYYLYLDDTRLQTYVTMVVRDVSGSKYTKLILKDAGKYFDSWVEVADNLETVINPISGIVYDSLVIQESTDSLRKQIAANSAISESQKSQLNAEVDAYENDRVWFTLLTSVLPTVVTATGGTMTGPAIVFTALLGAINAAADTFWDYRVGMILGCDPLDTSFSSAGSCGTPLTKDYLLNNDITQSGTYYLPEGAIGFDIGENDKPPVDVTLCLHGQDVNSISVAKGSTLHLCDCTYLENADGSVTGGYASSAHIRTGGKLILNNAIIGNNINRRPLSSNGGELIISGGTITGSITDEGGSRITVESGTIKGTISSEGNGEIIINGGNIGNVSTDFSSISIHDGQIKSRVMATGGTIYIDGGQIGQSGTKLYASTVHNRGGRLEICGGTILGYVYNDKTGTAYISGGEVICERMGDDNAAGAYSAIENDGGNMTITGGVFKGMGRETYGYATLCMENSAGGNVRISGGTFQSTEGVCISNKGEISITNGTFLSYSSLVSNNGGKVTIRDGQFQSKNGACVQNFSGTAIISSGYFQGTYGITAYRSIGNILLIHSNSAIEMNTTKGAFHSSSGEKIVMETDYNGSITYYDTTNATGVKMLTQEAANIDYTKPYVRLIADGATDDPSEDDLPHGRIAISATFAKDDFSGEAYTIGGETVTLRAYPDDGYYLSAIRVIRTDGQEVSLSGSGSIYTFQMPHSDITVYAKFSKI